MIDCLDQFSDDLQILIVRQEKQYLFLCQNQVAYNNHIFLHLIVLQLLQYQCYLISDTTSEKE